MTDQVLAEWKAHVRIRMSVVIMIIFHRHLLSTCCMAGTVLGMGTPWSGGNVCVSHPHGAHIPLGEGDVHLNCSCKGEGHDAM